MTQQDIFNLIVAHTREIMPGLDQHSFKPEDRLADLGANSIDRADIVMMTLEALSLRIPLVELANARNIGELSALLAAKSA